MCWWASSADEVASSVQFQGILRRGKGAGEKGTRLGHASIDSVTSIEARPLSWPLPRKGCNASIELAQFSVTLGGREKKRISRVDAGR